MIDDPPYIRVKYYYNTKESLDSPSFKRKDFIGSLILTKDGCVYFDYKNSKPIVPDYLSDERIVPYDWMNEKSIKYIFKNQPYDFDEWQKGSMISKNLWKLILEDMRIVKRDYSIEKILNKTDFKWVSAD